MADKKKIYIASDHAGFPLKEEIKEHFRDFEWVDLGPFNPDRVDYPDFADKVSLKIQEPGDVGILVCGSGQGVAMRANKYPHIRAALCWNEECAMLSRQHNDANILTLGSRLIPSNVCFSIIKTFLSTDFEGGRHADRVEKLKGPLK